MVDGPTWLKDTPSEWPNQLSLPNCPSPEAAIEVCHVTTTLPVKSSRIVTLNQYSSFERLRRVIAWIIHFINNCRSHDKKRFTDYLKTAELHEAEAHIFLAIQAEQFPLVINLLRTNQIIPKGNCLLPLSPLIDSNGLIRVGARQKLGHLSSSQKHLIILHGNHPIVKLLIITEHKQLLHGGPTLVISSLTYFLPVFFSYRFVFDPVQFSPVTSNAILSRTVHHHVTM